MAATQDAFKQQVFRSLKRTHEMFLSENGKPIPLDTESQELKIKAKVNSEYGRVKDYVPPEPASRKPADAAAANPLAGKAPSEVAALEVAGKLAKPAAANGTAPAAQAESTTEMSKLIDSVGGKAGQSAGAGGVVALRTAGAGGQVAVAGAAGQSQALMPRQAPQVPKPKWHPPWKLYRVIAGHSGWVRCLSFDPTNQWFASGSNDRTIKIWDVASGTLKVTLTGHISHVRAVAVSPRHPYLFSASEDKEVKCWDLECNKVIRNYHGHLSAVYSLSVHPTLDVIVTGSRDSTARVWDMRTKQCVHVLSGHTDSVATVLTQAPNPQVTTASYDGTVRLWDIAAGKSITTLTNHKKAVRAACSHPTEFTFASGSADNIKKWRYPNGDFMLNMDPHKAVVNAMAVNADDVMVTAADNGTLQWYDYKTGYNFQKFRAPPQPGSLESECGVYAVTYDQSGSRIVTAEADKSIKMYREDETATEESHPVVWRPDLRKKKF